MRNILIGSVIGAAVVMAYSGWASNGTPMMQGNSPESTRTQQQPAPPSIAEMRARQLKMQEQMKQIRQTKYPQERQRLMREHWQTMQESMRMMHQGRGMDGCPMMGMGDMHGMRMPAPDDTSTAALKRREQMMDNCMRMHSQDQMMMDQMMDNQDMWMRDTWMMR
jgi:hypothetical protein